MRELYGEVYLTNEDKKKAIRTFYDERDIYLEKNKKRLMTDGYRILDKLYKDNQENIINRLHKGNNIEKLARELIEVVMRSDCMKDKLIDEVPKNAMG